MPFKIYEFKELLRGINFSSNDIILDIGCNRGLQTLLLGARGKKIIGIDILKEPGAAAKRISQYMKKRNNSEFRCVKLENAGFENEYFDKIFSICVIEHIANYDEILREAYRILKRDGQMIFSVDSLETIEDNKLVDKHKKDHHVEKYFKKEELKSLLEGVGFKRIDIYPIFKSDFAKMLFIEGIRNNFQYGQLNSILSYFRLRYEEKHCADKNKGIFLIVKCCK